MLRKLCNEIIVTKNMKREEFNPFLLTGYENPDYFCDRSIETEKIKNAIENGRNITLISPRRMGKTGLIRHTFYFMEKDFACFYIDIFQTQSLPDFVKLLANTIIGALDNTSQKIITNIFSFFKSLRLVITTDPYSGAPRLTVDFAREKAEESLKEIFDYLASSGKRCCIAIDEFQQITNYPEKGVEALLRSYIQQQTHIHFIFSGSQKHVMENMFTSVSRPFFQSTQILPLKEINFLDYVLFAKRHFEKNGKSISDEAVQWIYDTVAGHTWYVQMLLNRLYSYSEVSVLQVQKVLSEILAENEATFFTYCKLLTNKQLALLSAIASETSITEPTASAFISKYGLGATSTVSASLKSLLEKELLFENNGAYFVYDRFFSLWLKKNPK